jgi:hypothetical protein
MKDMELKKKVLGEIMDLMNEKDGEMLGKHPKLMAAKIEIEPKEGEEKEMDLEKDPKEEMMGESPLESEKEDSLVEGLTPEMIEKLKEMLGE